MNPNAKIDNWAAIYWIYKLLLVFLGLVYVAIVQREPILCLIVGNLAAFMISDVTDAMISHAQAREQAREQQAQEQKQAPAQERAPTQEQVKSSRPPTRLGSSDF